MLSYTEYLEYNGVTLEDLEPEEVKELCRDSAFRALCDWCARARGWTEPEPPQDDARFDADELGIDPEEDAEHA